VKFQIAAALVLASTFAAPAFARSGGMFGHAGDRPAAQGAPGSAAPDPTVLVNCTRCHVQTSTPAQAPTVTVDGLDAVVAGEDALFTLTVHTNDATGGSGDCPNRCAGIGVAIAGGSTFSVVDPGTKVNEADATELTHTEPRPFVDNDASFALSLASLAPGDYTLFVAANDVDGAGRSGDRVTLKQVAFTVSEPEAPAVVTPPVTEPVVEPVGTSEPTRTPETDAPSESSSSKQVEAEADAPAATGCSATGVGSSASLAGLVLGLAALRRRKR
jgi:uncharacterized protein (TIGR03382 family)